jgi:NAD(P)H-dependent flavin oxidoreductase YrpB (nitropropane dioxygenase family)
MKTTLCTRFGIEVPIIQAPMRVAVGPALASAVSNAGGLGMLALWRFDAETMREQIRETRALTSKPFGVNLNLEFPQDERLDVCLAEKVPIIHFFWRDPGALVRRAKEAGAIVMHTVASANMARRAVESGVDVVVAQGWEAGGHVRGTVATLPLIPRWSMWSARLPWLRPAALLTVAGSPPCSHSAPRAHGSAPDFSRARRRPYIRATASGC